MKITVFYNNKKYEKFYDSQVSLMDVIRSVTDDFDFVCSGSGKCGKCKVKATGNVSVPSMTEEKFLQNETDNNIRLACMTQATGDCAIFLHTDSNDIDKILSDEKFVACIDIGTTTVEYRIYRSSDLECVLSYGEKNLQSAFGSDVISRISYSVKNGTDELCRIINDQINKFFEKTDIRPDFTVITGNTAMLHLYKNVDVAPLSAAPFKIKEKFGLIDNTQCIPACISAFIGADTVCGILSSGMLNDEVSMLIDIGTNGEIAYKNGDRIICASSAAGPAFEGAGIKCGTIAKDGAINKVYGIGNKIEYQTVNGKSPVGITGSGVIDAVAVMLRLGYIEPSGYLESDFYLSDSGVYISPEDVRAVQLAKAAIRAAMETVCEDLTKVEKFYIAGNFGKFLDLNNAVSIGLLPECVKGRTVVCGNSALNGAEMILHDRDNLDIMNKIAEKADVIQLAENQLFFEKYINYMNF